MRLIEEDTLIDAIEKCGEEKIYPQALIETIKALPSANRPITKDTQCQEKNDHSGEATEMVDLISRAEVHNILSLLSTEGCKDAKMLIMDAHEFIDALPSDDRPKGEWTEKEVMVDEDTNITEWQSARCSVCGRYHTTPYMYYFDNFNFCPHCGADMRGV